MPSKRSLYNRGRFDLRLGRNPEEARFAEAWNKLNRKGDKGILGDLVNPKLPPSSGQRELAATLIQWLGSHVGGTFLEGLGYTQDGGSRFHAQHDGEHRFHAGQNDGELRFHAVKDL